MPEYRIEIQAAFQRFKPPALTDITTPRNEILLERHGKLLIVRTELRDVAKQELRFPLATLAIFPSDTQRNDTHIATGLNNALSRYQKIPMLAVAHDAAVISGQFTISQHQSIMNYTVLQFQLLTFLSNLIGCMNLYRTGNKKGSHNEYMLKTQ